MLWKSLICRDLKKNSCECLLTTPTLTRLTVQEKGIVNETHCSILSSQSHHGCREFLLSGSGKHRKGQCGKTTGLNSAMGQPLLLCSPTQGMHTHMCAHTCSVCTQGYTSKAQEYIIILLNARCFSYSIPEILESCIFLRGRKECASDNRVFATEVICKIEANSDVEFLKMVKIISNEVFLKSHLISC